MTERLNNNNSNKIEPSRVWGRRAQGLAVVKTPPVKAVPSPTCQEKMGRQAPQKWEWTEWGFASHKSAPLEASGCVIIHYICLKCEFKQNHKLGYAKKARMMVIVSA